jgi:phosphoribosylcarboxyaminoimidazole (NCAIR) mutase
MAKQALVGIVVGSISDWEVMQQAARRLKRSIRGHYCWKARASGLELSGSTLQIADDDRY